MNMPMEFAELERVERGLVEQFHRLPLFGRITEMSATDVLWVLRQRRFFSLIYTPLFDMIVDGLSDTTAVAAVRHLLSEEYPGGRPSHREDLAADLICLGATRDMLITDVPTRATEKAIRRAFQAIMVQQDQHRRNLSLLAIARFLGEVLVAEEYEALFPRLEALGLSRAKSRFYWPHVVHDKETNRFSSSSSARSHSDMLTVELIRLADTSEKMQCCVAMTREAFAVKSDFYAQF